MTEKKDTIQNILSEDNRKHLAEILLNNEITDMVVIYRKGNTFRVDASDEAVATTIGMLEMAKSLVMEEWLHPIPDYSEICEDGEQEGEDEA